VPPHSNDQTQGMYRFLGIGRNHGGGERFDEPLRRIKSSNGVKIRHPDGCVTESLQRKPRLRRFGAVLFSRKGDSLLRSWLDGKSSGKGK